MANSGKTTPGAGHKDQQDTPRKSGGQGSGGNVANDRTKASEAGKKGGAQSHAPGSRKS
ncbi:general stress protein [uncultured Pseudomonas sp.]|uniref:general stress protein n=1 Tax=uncultured Pseudomonas sp. TaxID=114707 RepID=UPI0025FC3515|nr:general stress protein [uncultured Pseudomonas sp.]